MNTPTTPQPSPAAMRAARALCPQIAHGVDSGEFVPQMLTDRAEIVDRETALPELIAAADALLNELDGEALHSTGTANAGVLFEHANTMREALAKARKA